jgi:inner membrane protein
MTGRTHDLAAFTFLTVVVVSLPMPSISLGTAITAIVANLIGGIAPDIDEPTAPFWRNLPVGGMVGRVFGAVVGGHRFILHSLVGMFLAGLVIDLFLAFLHPSWPSLNAQVVWWAFMIGYFSHLTMDSLTKEGVPWLLPVPFKFGFPPIKAWRVTTGKWVEAVIIFPGLLLLELYLIYTHYAFLVDLLRHLGK